MVRVEPLFEPSKVQFIGEQAVQSHLGYILYLYIFTATGSCILNRQVVQATVHISHEGTQLNAFRAA